MHKRHETRLYNNSRPGPICIYFRGVCRPLFILLLENKGRAVTISLTSSTKLALTTTLDDDDASSLPSATTTNKQMGPNNDNIVWAPVKFILCHYFYF